MMVNENWLRLGGGFDTRFNHINLMWASKKKKKKKSQTLQQAVFTSANPPFLRYPISDPRLPTSAKFYHVFQARSFLFSFLTPAMDNSFFPFDCRDWLFVFVCCSGGKLKPLKQPKADKKDYDEVFPLIEASFFFSSYFPI